MENLVDKIAKVVNKSETLDPEDMESVAYEITFALHCDGDVGHTHPHTTVVLTTDDKLMFDRFKIGTDVDWQVLDHEGKLKSFPKNKAN